MDAIRAFYTNKSGNSDTSKLPGMRHRSQVN